jgi:hypothetical protein
VTQTKVLSRSRVRRTSLRRTFRRRAGVTALCIGVAAVIGSLWALGAEENRAQLRSLQLLTSTLHVRTVVPARQIALARNPSIKRNYPYSVIPGGARSREELTDAIARDSVVAAHYRSISVGSVHAETVSEDRLAYMSYRIGNKIYWTKNKVRLAKGETILTDGVTQVRGRCGNCISLQPMGPTSDDEPDTVQFEALTAPVPAIPAPPPVNIGIGAGTIVARELVSGLNEPFGPFGGVPGGPSLGGGLLPLTSQGSSSPGPEGGSPSSDLASLTLPVLPGFLPEPPNVVPPVGDPNGGGGDNPFTPPTDKLPPLIVDDPPLVIHVQPPPETAPVPEPGTLLLVTGGIGALLSRRRKKS